MGAAALNGDAGCRPSSATGEAATESGTARAGWRPAALAVLAILSVSSCGSAGTLVATLRSTRHFVPLASDGRVLHEPGAEGHAERIPPLLPGAIEAVEAGHHDEFAGPVRVHVCSTPASFERLTGHRSPAAVVSKLFLSPRLFLEDRPLDRYLAHELSHLHLRQKLGLVRTFVTPAWFKEGLAEMVSGGATARLVSPLEAYAAVAGGRGFVPDAGRGLLRTFVSPRYGNHWNLEPAMFYRQCMLFVTFMREQDESAFRRLLAALGGGERFKRALSASYGVPLAVLWGRFVEHAEARAGRASTRQGGPRDGAG